MYRIENKDGYLLVTLENDLDCNAANIIIHHVTTLQEYPHTNDLWMFGKHRTNIRLDELRTMAREFQCHCPRDGADDQTGTAHRETHPAEHALSLPAVRTGVGHGPDKRRERCWIGSGRYHVR